MPATCCTTTSPTQVARLIEELRALTAPHEKIAGSPERPQDNPMEAEHINQIGANSRDLSARTEDLRRYL